MSISIVLCTLRRAREEEAGCIGPEAAPRGRVRDARRRQARQTALRVARARCRGARGEGGRREEGTRRLRLRSRQICGSRRAWYMSTYVFKSSTVRVQRISTSRRLFVCCIGSGGTGGSKQASSEREASTLELLKQFESQLQSATPSGLVRVVSHCDSDSLLYNEYCKLDYCTT